MERYNIFNLIHKALKAALYQTCLQLQQTDFTGTEEVEETLNRVREVIMLFDDHSRKERDYILQAINPYEPSVAAAIESDYDEKEALSLQLAECMEIIEKAFSDKARKIAGRNLNELFVSYSLFNLKHMSRKETVINPLLWRYFSDAEIRKMSLSMSQSTAPWMQEFYAGWMLRAMNFSETAALMKSVKRSLPDISFQSLVQKAQSELPGQRFRKLVESIAESAQTAGS